MTDSLKPKGLQPPQKWMGSLCGCCGASYGWDWSWVDQVYCINLRDRVDRFLEAQCEFHRVGLCDKLLFYRPERPTASEWQQHQQHLTDTNNHDMIMTVTKGAYGCWQSHKAVVEHALQHGYKKILIFEDDITFLPTLTKLVAQQDIPNAIHDLPPDADFLHLGYFPIRGAPLIHDGKSSFGQLWSVRALCTVAYVATLKGMHTIRDAEMSLPIDFWMIKHASQYALYPKIAWQRKSATDVDELWLGCPSNYVKELGNYVYRNHHTIIDSLMLILVPILFTLVLIVFLAYAAYFIKHILLRPSLQTKNEPTPPKAAAAAASASAASAAAAAAAPVAPAISPSSSSPTHTSRITYSRLPEMRYFVHV